LVTGQVKDMAKVSIHFEDCEDGTVKTWTDASPDLPDLDLDGKAKHYEVDTSALTPAQYLGFRAMCGGAEAVQIIVVDPEAA
jgi:hypothetical protein